MRTKRWWFLMVQISCCIYAPYWNLHRLTAILLTVRQTSFIFFTTCLIVSITFRNASLIAINGFFTASVIFWTAIFTCSWKKKVMFVIWSDQCCSWAGMPWRLKTCGVRVPAKLCRKCDPPKEVHYESIWNLLNWTSGEYRLNFFSNYSTGSDLNND
jgi:hypothetical protein